MQIEAILQENREFEPMALAISRTCRINLTHRADPMSHLMQLPSTVRKMLKMESVAFFPLRFEEERLTEGKLSYFLIVFPHDSIFANASTTILKIIPF